MAHRHLFDGKMDFSRRENVETVFRLLQESHEEPRSDALARLHIGVLLRDHGTDAESRAACASMCGHWSTRTTIGAPPPRQCRDPACLCARPWR